MPNACEGRPRMLKWASGRHCAGFSFRSPGRCTNTRASGYSPSVTGDSQAGTCCETKTSRSISRRQFFKLTGLAGAGVTISMNAFSNSLDAVVEFQIDDSDTHVGIEGAHIKAVHHSNPSLVYETDTDLTGDAKLDGLVTEVKERPVLPTDYRLEQNFPNPFRQSTSLQFSMPAPGNVKLAIYDLLGRQVAELYNNNIQEGTHTIRWGGLSDNGVPVAKGIYYATLQAGGQKKTVKLNKTGNTGAYTTKDVSSGALQKRIAGDLYDITVTKSGYTSLSRSESISGGEKFDWEMGKSDKKLKLYLIDNQSLETIKGKVDLEDTILETDEQGYLEIPVSAALLKLATLKAYGTNNAGERSSFIQTYRDLPLDTEHPLGIMITTFKDLTDVDPSLAIDPELFRDFAYEGVFNDLFSKAGLKGMDFQNAQNPVPNPDGASGVVYWIDSDFASRFSSGYFGTFSKEEQIYMKDVIEKKILSHFRDPTHKPQIYLAQPGDNLPLKQGETALKPDNGIIFVTHRHGGNGYTFGWNDYDKNGVVDSPVATIGDPTNIDEGKTHEAGSIIVLNAINNDALKGKTNFSEGGSTGFLTPADLKILGIQENMSAKENPWQDFQLSNGTYVSRGHYKPLTHMDDILGNQ